MYRKNKKKKKQEIKKILLIYFLFSVFHMQRISKRIETMQWRKRERERLASPLNVTLNPRNASILPQSKSSPLRVDGKIRIRKIRILFVTILACYVRTKWPHRNYPNRGIWHPGQGEQKQWASVPSLRLSRWYRQQSFERETEEKRAHGLGGEYRFIWQLLGCRVKFRKNYYPVPHLSDLSFQPALETRWKGDFSVKELREIRIF